MSDMQCCLDDYPLEEHYSVCENYIYNTLNWNLISKQLSEERVIFVDVSDALALFTHLEIDADYRLICYLSREYHGIWGRVAAIKSGDSCELINDPNEDWLIQFELPEGAVPPMEVIYNDGSPYGYLEAILAEEFLGAIPYAQFEQEHWDRCILRYPEDFQTDWDIYEKITDLRPHIITSRNGSVIVSLCWRHFENGHGSSDGCDVLRLAQHTFAKDLKWYHFVNSMNKKRTVYKTQIDDDTRYCKGKHCSVATERSITIAVQKK